MVMMVSPVFGGCGVVMGCEIVVVKCVSLSNIYSVGEKNHILIGGNLTGG